MHKFYTLEDLTQEELNKLSLERNTLDSNWNELKNWLDNICFYDNDTITYEQLSDKMQELESNNENNK